MASQAETLTSSQSRHGSLGPTGWTAGIRRGRTTCRDRKRASPPKKASLTGQCGLGSHSCSVATAER
eukprot:8594362-Lingulodinium_polyedra.AAC.1